MMRKIVRWVIWGGLCMWAALTVLRLISNTFAPVFTINPPYVDFHSFWYPGHFIRQGTDPYQASLDHRELKLPIQYLDGKVISAQPVAQMPLGNLPTLTAPLVLFMSLFSFFSWPVAKAIWMVFLLSFLGLIPVLMFQILPERGKSLTFYQKSLIVFIFMGLSATRSAASGAHASLLVLTLMLAAILIAPRSWVGAGILLGFAMSKFPLALPILLWFFIDRKYKIILAAFLLQFVGVLGLWVITKASPITIIQEYFLILKLSSSQVGIQLSSLLPPNSNLSTPLSLLFSFIIFSTLIYWIVKSNSSLATNKSPFLMLHILAILSLWSTLASYHRTYDAILYILFISIILYGLQNQVWNLTHLERIALIFFFIVSDLFMMTPGNITFFFFSDTFNRLWLTFTDKAITIALLLSTFISLWLLFREKLYELQT